jgi:hypothetical protein
MKQMMAAIFASLLLLFSNTSALAQSSDTATVIFYRSSDDGGKAYALTSQNQELVKLKKGEKFEQSLASGTYYYMADPTTRQVFKLEITAGNTYYVKAGRDENLFDGKPTLQITSSQQYQQALANAD